MSKLYIATNFATAFIIGAGTAFGIAFLGGEPTKWQIYGCLAAGAVVAAKDTRSLLKMPPIDDKQTQSKP